MSSTLQEIALGALDECQQPDVSAPRIDYVMSKARDMAGVLRNRAQNVLFNWDARAVQLMSESCTAIIMFTGAQADERPTSIITMNPDDTSHVPRVIPIVNPQDVFERYEGPAVGDNIVVFSHWREQGTLYLQPHPFLRESAEPQSFTVWLESGTVPKAPQSQPLAALGGFDAYLKTLTARAILPACQWSRMDKEDARELKRDLERALDDQLIMWDGAFSDYINNGWEQHAPLPHSYGSWLGGNGGWL